MAEYPFVTVDVFTQRRFGGNPLAVFTSADALSDDEMQALAAEFNLSETAFVLAPRDPAHTARVRIFHRTAEMPFAGHPLVGAACVLADMGRDQNGVLRFEVIAGIADVHVERSASGRAVAATVAAPQVLALGPEIPADVVAACAGLETRDVVTNGHNPVLASVGTSYVITEVRPEALSRASPDVDAFRRMARAVPALRTRSSVHFYAREGDRLRARMFSPLAGTHEDPATGSANAALAALLLSLGDAPSLSRTVVQGVEMGRPSALEITATRAADGIRATVGGGCVPVFRGTYLP